MRIKTLLFEIWECQLKQMEIQTEQLRIQKLQLQKLETLENLLVKGFGIMTGIDFCEHDFEYDAKEEALHCKKCPHIVYGVPADLHVHVFELSVDKTKKKCKLCPLEIPLES